MLQMYLLSSGSRVRILPGAPGQSVASFLARVPGSQMGSQSAYIGSYDGCFGQASRARRGFDLLGLGKRSQYIGAVSLGSSASGARIRKKVMERIKTEVRGKLRELHAQVDKGVRPRRHYTVGDALDDWLAHGLDGLAPSTVTLYRDTIAKALREEFGSVKLTALTAG